jgi:hypothetical protein
MGKQRGRTLDNEPQADFTNIFEFVKETIIRLINEGKYIDATKTHLSELILLLCDRFFPASWDELVQIFKQTFQLNLEAIMTNKAIVYNFSELFYKVLKQHNRKRTPLAKSKIQNTKNFFIELFVPFYQNINGAFDNIMNLNNLDIFMSYLDLLIVADKILLIMIEIFFNINDFHNDTNIVNMLNTIISKAYFILERVNNSNERIAEFYQINLYKIIKNLIKIQTANPIILFRDLERLINLDIVILDNSNVFSVDVVKSALLGLYKIILTSSYQELLNNTNPTNDDFPEKYDLVKTPTKNKSMTKLSVLTSPTKYRNFEIEHSELSNTYIKCFNDDNIKLLLNSLIKKVPFVFRKEIDNIEIEILAEVEDDNFIGDTASISNLTWVSLHKALLEAIISTFPNTAMKFINSELELLYQNVNNENMNMLLIDSVIIFVNIIPGLYRNGTIKEVQMIDCEKYFNYIEQISRKSEMILQRYILTISKWADVLISNDSMFKYLENIIFLLHNCKKNLILLECCLALKTIITTLDKYTKSVSSGLSLSINRDKVLEDIKTKINWSDLLVIVSRICWSFMNQVKSAELILSLIGLFNILIQKCHYQCDGQIIEAIKNSQILDIINSVNDEFGQHAFVEMFKLLLLSFSDSTIIAEVCLIFISNCIKKDVNNTHILGLLVFAVRILNYSEEIRNLLLAFLKNHISLFESNNKQYITIYLFNILEELILFNIFDYNDINMMLKLVYNKYLPIYEHTKEHLLRYLENKKLGNSDINKNNDLIYTDISEYKSSAIAILNTALIYFETTNNANVLHDSKEMLALLLDELYLSKDGPSSIYTTVYFSNLVPLINRVCVYDFEFFNQILSDYLKVQQITFNEFFMTWIFRMENMISIEAR